jgi:hypothetical protein
MIGCYLDESIDPKQQGIFGVGGLLGVCRPVFELDRKWEALRKRPDINIEYFKASECQMGKKQFRKFVVDPDNITEVERKKLDGIWNDFLDVMAGDELEHVIIFGMGVVQEDFYRVIKDPRAHAVLGDSPYWFAYQSAMLQAAFAMKSIKKTGHNVAFICDEHEEHSPIAHGVYREVKKKIRILLSTWGVSARPAITLVNHYRLPTRQSTKFAASCKSPSAGGKNRSSEALTSDGSSAS